MHKSFARIGRSKLISALAALMLILFVVTAFCGCTVDRSEEPQPKQTEIDYFADVTDSFFRENFQVLQKDPTRPYRILNLTDTQTSDMGGGEWGWTRKTIETLVGEQKPDLITMTGDQVWLMSAKKTLAEQIALLESFKIPWAPVFGNHDIEISVDLPVADIVKAFEEAEHCLFKKGSVDGNGNYVLLVCEGRKIVETLIMMDTHSSTGLMTYDHLHQNQIEWYSQVMDRVADLKGEGTRVTSQVFFHIPPYETNAAYAYWASTGFDAEIGNGRKTETINSPNATNGFFELAKEKGTTHIYYGHDHVNTFKVHYQGIYLCYTLKTGDLCYADKSMNGGTLITIESTPDAPKTEVTDKFVYERTELMQKIYDLMVEVAGAE